MKKSLIAATKKELVDEIIQCGRSPSYFINTYARIQHPVKGLVPFATFDYQNDSIAAFVKHRLNIVLKGRQLGFTTIIAAFIAWFIIFQKDKNVLIVSTKAEVAKNTIRIIRNILKYVPQELLLCRIVVDNRQSIELTNGSRVKAITTSADAGRSEAVSLLFVDEVAHIERMDELWTGIWPTISAGGRAILSSTPKGTSNFFYRTYKQAQNYENNFNCRFGTYVNPNNPLEQYRDRFMWWVMPGHDQAWFEEETAGKNSREIAQEYCCAFNASGDTFLPNNVLSLAESQICQPRERAWHDHNFWVWKYPQPGGIYLISCDVSSGFSEDFSAFHVLRVDGQLEQVAEYKGKIPADMLGELLLKVGMKYNYATIAPENNSGWSAQAIQKIKEADYPHLYYSTRRGHFIDLYNSAQIAEAMPGYRVTSANRDSMLAKVEEYLRKGDLQIKSQRLYDEFTEFLWINNRAQAARMAHDDLIMALAGGIWLKEEAFMATYKSSDNTKALLAGMSRETTSVTQYNGFNEGSNDPFNSSKVTLANGTQVDLSTMLITSG